MVLEPGCVCFLPSLLPRLYHLPLSQTPTVVPIPGYLLFAHGVFGHCIALDSQPGQDLDQQRHNAGSSAKICAPWLAFSRVKGRSAAELEEAEVECAGCLCTLEYKSGCFTTIQEARNYARYMYTQALRI